MPPEFAARINDARSSVNRAPLTVEIAMPMSLRVVNRHCLVAIAALAALLPVAAFAAGETAPDELRVTVLHD